MKRIRRPRFAALAAALVVAFVLSACEPPTPPEPASTRVDVRVASPHRGAIARVLSVTGQTAALSIVRLASPIGGRVTQLSVQPGDALARGDVAARVVTMENEAALNGLALVEHAGGPSADERDMGARLQRDLRGRDVPLFAPFASVVAARLHNPGELVAANDVLLELVDPKSLYVLAQVPIENAAEIHPGLPVEVGAPAAARGVVTALVPAAAASLTVPVRVALDAPPRPALLEASVPCRITLARHEDALLIPRAALVTSNLGEEGGVMVVDGSVARARAVRLGLRSEGDVEVIAGLAPEDVVIVEGQYGLPDGTEIRPLRLEP